MATSTSDPTVTSTTSGTLVVTAGGVQVTLNPGSARPGSSFQATVTNTGTVADTYNVVLAGPAALVSSLETSQVTLAPGASSDRADQHRRGRFRRAGQPEPDGRGDLDQQPGHPGHGHLGLAIPATTGMTADFSPASQTLSSPGTATFLLTVQNTGNTEDTYSATIIGANGPVTATLIGPDGSPTQSVPLFRLAGLSTGTIVLRLTSRRWGRERSLFRSHR